MQPPGSWGGGPTQHPEPGVGEPESARGIWARAEEEEESGRTVGTNSPSWASARGQGAGRPGAITAGTTNQPPAKRWAFCVRYPNAQDTL